MPPTRTASSPATAQFGSDCSRDFCIDGRGEEHRPGDCNLRLGWCNWACARRGGSARPAEHALGAGIGESRAAELGLIGHYLVLKDAWHA